MMTLSVVVVSYNVREFVKQCLTSLNRSHFNGRIETILVDNNSYDGTVELVRRSFPEVVVCPNSENRGFAAAANQGIAAASGETVLLLNPDTIVEEDTLQILTDYLNEHPNVGCVGPKILNSDGSLQQACKRSFPRPWVALTRLLGLARLFPTSRLFGQYNLTYLDPDLIHAVDAISGSCMCMPRRVVDEVGPMDEVFFLFGEDLDYCYRIRHSGYDVIYLPQTQIVHFKGESTKTAPFDSLRMFYEAMVTFSDKYHSLSGGAAARILIRFGILLRAGLAFIRSSLATFSSLIIDALVIGAAFFTMICVRFLPDPNFRTREMLYLYAPVVAVYAVLWLGIGGLFQIYGRYVLSYSRTLITSLVGFLVIATLTYLYRNVAYSRLVLVSASALVAIMLPGWRLVVHLRRVTYRIGDSYRAQRPSLFSRRAVIMGTDTEGQRIAGLLLKRPDTGIELLGFILNEADAPSTSGDTPALLPILGRIGELKELRKKHRFQEVIVTGKYFSNQQLMVLLEETRDLPLLFRIVLHDDEVMLGKANIEYIGDLPFASMEAVLYRRFHLLSKRLFDILVSGLLILPLILFMPLIVLICRLERRTIWTVNGGQVSIRLLGRGGRGFRNLPLLWSIFKGDLSFVGSGLVYTDEPDPCLLCKPGITGLTQIGKAIAQSEVTKSYDHYYMLHQSLTFDLEIILKALLRI